jgi:hypothetical protein
MLYEFSIQSRFELREASCQLSVGAQRFAKLNKRTYDVDAHLNCMSAIQDHGSHDRTVLSKSVGREARVTMLLGTGRNLRPVQILNLFDREPEQVIERGGRASKADANLSRAVQRKEGPDALR